MLIVPDHLLQFEYDELVLLLHFQLINFEFANNKTHSEMQSKKYLKNLIKYLNLLNLDEKIEKNHFDNKCFEADEFQIMKMLMYPD